MNLYLDKHAASVVREEVGQLQGPILYVLVQLLSLMLI